ncbi:MAG: flagellar FliJ family protein [Alphaproteobacteria bacterium]|nr:flagellar FliJ family protein [Alphaproteobacteria bacterium]
MKSLPILIKLQKQRVDEQRLILARMREHLAQIEAKIENLKNEQEAQKELVKKDHEVAMTYGAYLKDSMKRMDDLKQKERAAKAAVQVALDKLAAVFEEQKRYEIALRHQEEQAAKLERQREGKAMDEIGSVRFVRKKEE